MISPVTHSLTTRVARSAPTPAPPEPTDLFALGEDWDQPQVAPKATQRQPVIGLLYERQDDGTFLRSSRYALAHWPFQASDGGQFLDARDARGEVTLVRLGPSGEERFSTPLPEGTSVRDIKESDHGVVLWAQHGLVLLEPQTGKILGQAEFEEARVKKLSMGQDGFIANVGETVRRFDRTLTELSCLDLGYDVREMEVAQDGQVAITSGGGNHGLLEVYDKNNERTLSKKGVDSGSLRGDGRYFFYLDGFISGSYRTYDTETGRDRHLTSRASTGKIHPLGDGHYVSKEQNQFSGVHTINVNSLNGKDRSFSLGHYQRFEGAYTDGRGELYITTRQDSEVKLYRLPEKEGVSAGDVMGFWMPWLAMTDMVGDSMELVYTSREKFEPVVFEDGRLAVLDQSGLTFLNPQGEPVHYGSPREALRKEPTLVSCRVSPKWLDYSNADVPTFGQLLRKVAHRYDLDLPLHLGSQAEQVEEGVPSQPNQEKDLYKVALEKISEDRPGSLRGQEPWSAPGCPWSLRKIEGGIVFKSEAKPYGLLRLERGEQVGAFLPCQQDGEFLAVIGTDQGRVLLVNPQQPESPIQFYLPEGRQVTGAAVVGEEIRVGGSDGSIVAIRPGGQLRTLAGESETNALMELEDDLLVVGDHPIPIEF